MPDNSVVSKLQPNTRVYDRRRHRERLVHHVELQNSIAYLSLRDPQTGEVERLPFVIASLADRFEVLPCGSSAFSADSAMVRLVAEAHRLNHAYLFNPVFATETSLIDPLPHQLVAVYGLPADPEHPEGAIGLLSIPRLRFLLADDAGAGKTIMAGLYVREMLLRRLIRRVLVIPPAGLVGNWESELRNLFRLRFRIIESSDVREDENPFASSRNELGILSVDTARQERVRAALNAAPPYDLVICDEAHKLAARRNPDLTVDKSKRYETVEEVAARCEHLLLLTATPHMGKDEPYFFLWRLMEPQLFSTPDSLYRCSPQVRRRHILRRMKEEMVTFDGRDLYPPRESTTVSYPLNDEERVLYEAVTGYVEEYYRRASQGNRSSVGLALTVIQRRLASSTWAILRSLERREGRLSETLRRLQQGLLTADEFAKQQEGLPTKDLREEKTADEEESEDGVEEGERFDDEVGGATTARSAQELAEELDELRALVAQARSTYALQRESKFERLQELLKQHPGTKVLIFTEHKDTLDFLVARMEGLGYTGQIATIHGGMDYRERERQTARFRSAECPYLIATDAAGEGINLQFCWLLINYDIPWNPARLEQRMGRVHRYKQQHNVLLLSLVAERTREGAVLQTLLDKLEAIRKRLGSDKVFDVIGEQLGGVSLADLLFQATVQGHTEQAKELLNRALDPETVAKRLQEQKLRVEVSEVRALLESLKRGQEVAEERRMMPAYVRTFFGEASKAVGVRCEGEDGECFRIVGAPESVMRALESYREELRTRLTFNREIALPKTALSPEAIYVHPGEQVFESVMTLLLGKFEPEAERGGVFYDASATEAYVFALAKIEVVRPVVERDGSVSASRETLGERMTGLVLESAGAVRVAPAHLLLTLELPAATQQVDMSGDDSQQLLTLAADPTTLETFVLEHVGVPLLSKLQQEMQERLPERVSQLTQSYNLRSVEGMAQRRRLKEDVAKGIPAAKTKLERLEAELAGLDDAREAAIAALHADIDLVELAPVTVYARALVLPLPPEEAERRRDVEAELTALRVVRAHEEGHGAQLEDVSDPNLATGYDLRSHRPDGTVRYIEVKGRSGLRDVGLTENEWRQAANHRDRYWLYVVYHCDTETPQLHRVPDPFGNLLAKSGGVIIAPVDVLGAAGA